ncbi:MAG: PASTA domain-containing protein [Clostridia bacterium]|nr:PASTA domain-containing protein [Clostridia bacterium]
MSMICNKCMAKIDSRVCPHCGDDRLQPQNPPMLPLGTLLNGRYRIGRCLRVAGDGYTYAALDMTDETTVSVTEFFPTNVVTRADDGLTVSVNADKKDYFAELSEDFSDLTRKLKKVFDATGLVQLLDTFKENDTRYYVCANFESMPLVEVVAEFRKTSARIWDKLAPIFDGFLAELEMVHRLGLVHRGIDDRSVLLCSDGTMKLDSFSIASARINGKGLRAVVSPQYAAPEQLCGTPYPDRTADIYAICGVMFCCATGRVYDREKMNMPEVFFGEDVPAHVVEAILKGLSADPEHRFASVGELRAALYGGASGHAVKTLSGKSTKRRFVFAIFAASILLLFGLVTAGLYYIFDINIFKIQDHLTSSTPSRVVVSLPEQNSQGDAVQKVPALVGLRYETVLEMYGDSEKFTIVTEMSDFNDAYPRNYVMAQTPDSGTPSPGNTTVTVTLSRGPEYLVMPKVIGLGLNEAYTKLTDLGFSVYLVEVQPDAALPTVTLPAGQQHPTGVVLDCPSAEGSIVRAESAIALYGALDMYATGTFSTTKSAIGTVVGQIWPQPVPVEGNVIEQLGENGTVTYLLQGETVQILPTMSFTYDENGFLMGVSEVPASIPTEPGTVSTITDYFGNVYTYFTYDPVPLQGTVTKTVSATGMVIYIQQHPPKEVAVEEVETVAPDGTVSITYEPVFGAYGGGEIPRATVEQQLSPDGRLQYVVIPIE